MYGVFVKHTTIKFNCYYLVFIFSTFLSCFTLFLLYFSYFSYFIARYQHESLSLWRFCRVLSHSFRIPRPLKIHQSYLHIFEVFEKVERNGNYFIYHVYNIWWIANLIIYVVFGFTIFGIKFPLWLEHYCKIVKGEVVCTIWFTNIFVVCNFMDL